MDLVSIYSRDEFEVILLNKYQFDRVSPKRFFSENSCLTLYLSEPI